MSSERRPSDIEMSLSQRNLSTTGGESKREASDGDLRVETHESELAPGGEPSDGSMYVTANRPPIRRFVRLGNIAEQSVPESLPGEKKPPPAFESNMIITSKFYPWITFVPKVREGAPPRSGP